MARRLTSWGPLALLLLGACAQAPATLRVGSSGDYAPFSVETATGWEGFDLTVARAYTADRGLSLQVVRFRWPELMADLGEERFDVAMSGITVRPERSAVGCFTVPVMTSGALILTRDAERFPTLASLDDPAIRIGVNAGGHLERVARATFPKARVEALPENAAVPMALERGSVDAIVSDTLEAPHWRRPGVSTLGPFTSDWKSYLVARAREDLAEDLDLWLLEREADGSLARWRRVHFGHDDGARTASPLTALFAAMDERLDLMPLVAEAKRESSGVVRVPEREARVLAAAVEATRVAAKRAGAPPPPDHAVRELFRAQIAAARAIQEHALSGAPAQGPPLDLDEALRPALLRIGRRIASLLVQLPQGIERAEARESAAALLRTPGLPTAARDAIADAIAALSAASPHANRRPGARGSAAVDGSPEAPISSSAVDPS